MDFKSFLSMTSPILWQLSENLVVKSSLDWQTDPLWFEIRLPRNVGTSLRQCFRRPKGTGAACMVWHRLPSWTLCFLKLLKFHKLFVGTFDLVHVCLQGILLCSQNSFCCCDMVLICGKAYNIWEVFKYAFGYDTAWSSCDRVCGLTGSYIVIAN